jgi:hypothetical protein
LLTVLTTQHFTLQGARGSTISESSARAALYIGALSSGPVALGFFGQGAEHGTAFTVFALVVLPMLYMLGGVHGIPSGFSEQASCLTDAMPTGRAAPCSWAGLRLIHLAGHRLLDCNWAPLWLHGHHTGGRSRG